MNGLPAVSIDQYRRDGYTIQRDPLFGEERLQSLTGIFEEHLTGKGEKRSDELDVPHFGDPRLLDFLMDEGVLDIVGSLIGSNIGLWSSHFISKEPRVGRATPWHSDAAYWHGRFEEFTGIVTVWLALDKTDRENGCMRVIPGTHRNEEGEYVSVDTGGNTFDTRRTRATGGGPDTQCGTSRRT
jgi:hypothetical protein